MVLRSENFTNGAQVREFYKWCQKVNWDKSVLCDINLEEDVVTTAVSLKCKVEHLPFIYLGLPLGSYPKKLLFGNRRQGPC